jgi:DNA mismatch repair protein MutS2
MFPTALEFDRIVDVVVGLALTPIGADELARLEPATEPRAVAEAINATSETTAYLEANALFPLRAGTGLEDALAVVREVGQLLEPLPLRTLADFLDSVETAALAVRHATGAFPHLTSVVSRAARFTSEVAAVRLAIDPGGEVLDQASPTLRSVRDQLRVKRQRLRATLDQFVRGRDTAKYLQEQVVTERNGRYVLLIRAEHRGHVPGIVHGSSASGASLFLEPSATVEINNDIVELEDREREEIRRILLELTDAFRTRTEDLQASIDVAAALDVLQAKARFGSILNGVAPEIAVDGRLELRAARHPLLIDAVRRRLDEQPGARISDVVPVDLILEPPISVLLITGPNTGGKTVALKTAGLLSLMAQAGLHVPAETAKLPVFSSIFADIGDEQSITASLSTFSAHITNIASMDRSMTRPALVLLDEVGTGTDPNEGGALATAIVSRFKQRGAMIIATTHYDAVKTWGTTTDGVTTAAFAFDPQTFAPTYRLVYGAPGRSLAIEIAQRLGMPLSVVSAARSFLSDDQKRLAAHLERVDAQARALESDRLRLQRDRRAIDDAVSQVQQRERAVADREERLARRLNEKLDDRVRQARRDIDQVIEQLKDRSNALIEQGAARGRTSGVSTGDMGAARAEAREALEQIVERTRQPDAAAPAVGDASRHTHIARAETGARVAIGALGMEGTITSIHGRHAEIDVRGKRLRAPVKDLRVIAPPVVASASGGPTPSRVRVSVNLKPREGLLSEINVIGCTVEEAVDRVGRFLDDTAVTDQQEVRVVHGHGTGQLRRGLAAYLEDHPLVARAHPAPREQGGEGVTVVVLKD